MPNNEEFKNRIRDLAKRSYNQNIYTFSRFLTLDEQSDVLSLERELSYAGMEMFGGIEETERKIVRFGRFDDLGYEEEYPIDALLIRPLIDKFSDELNHRDFLGALMNLGIERNLLGDIIVRDNKAYVFTDSSMTDYIKENLTRIKHTSVICEAVDGDLLIDAAPKFKEEEHIVANVRADAVISKLYNLSRSKSIELFKGGLVFADGRMLYNNSIVIKAGTRVSVRGYGKFIYDGDLGETKKGRIKFRIRKYI